MEGKRVGVIEIDIGCLFIMLGLFVWWWVTHLLWILIYPPPLAKQVLDSLPFVCWIVGALLLLDGIRRQI
jgi:hypothetical protein